MYERSSDNGCCFEVESMPDAVNVAFVGVQICYGLEIIVAILGLKILGFGVRTNGNSDT